MPITKARQLAEFIANADVDSDEIATGAVSASKLAATLDLSSKTIVLPDLDQAVTITSPSSAEGVKLNGRSADDIGQLKFYENDGTTSLARLDARTTHFEVGSYNELRFSAGGVGNNHVIVDASGKVGIGTTSPVGTLHLHSADTAVRLTSSQGSNTPLAQLQYSGSGGYFLRLGDSSNNEDVMIRTYGNSHFNGGNVGIGTTNPAAKLHVEGTSSGTAAYIENDFSWTAANLSEFSNSAFTIRPRNSDVYLKTSGSASDIRFQGINAANNAARDILFNAFGGNVGIGANTIQPFAKLEVAGTAGAQTGANQALYVRAASATANEGVGIRMSAASGSHEAVGIIGVVNNPSGNAGAMTFHTYNLGATIPERMRIDNVGNVGIGTTTPSTKLHVQSDGAGNGNGTFYLAIDTATNYPAMVIQTATGGNPTETHGLYIKNTANGFGLRIDDVANDTSPFVVAADGKVLIGDTTSNSDDLLQIQTPENGGGQGIHIRRNDSNSSQMLGRVMFGNNSVDSAVQIRADTDGAVNSGKFSLFVANAGGSYKVLEIGSSKNVQIEDGNLILANGHGIDFGATSNSSGSNISELLSDYEHGTWTPTIRSTQSNPSVNYNTQLGEYIRVGRLLHINFYIYVAANRVSGGAGYIKVGGLPFSVQGESNGGYPHITAGYVHTGGAAQANQSNNVMRFQANATPTTELSLYSSNHGSFGTGAWELSGSGTLPIY